MQTTTNVIQLTSAPHAEISQYSATFNTPLFLSWVGEVFRGNLAEVARELRYSPGHLAAVVRGRRPCSVKLARRIKRASQRLTPGGVLSMDELLDPRPCLQLVKGAR